jgi:hypothetical protein
MMFSIDPNLGLPTCFNNLVEASYDIAHGKKGVDFLVIIDGDEMKGYGSTECEDKFVTAADAVGDYYQANSSSVLPLKAIVKIILWSLVKANPAVDAYRSRLWAFATDWGSEVSPVGESSRLLQDIVDAIVEDLSENDRKSIYRSLPRDVREQAIERIYWESNDRHDYYYRSIKSILFPKDQ